jgi:hypothetical protein
MRKNSRPGAPAWHWTTRANCVWALFEREGERA